MICLSYHNNQILSTVVYSCFYWNKSQFIFIHLNKKNQICRLCIGGKPRNPFCTECAIEEKVYQQDVYQSKREIVACFCNRVGSKLGDLAPDTLTGYGEWALIPTLSSSQFPWKCVS